MESPSVVFCCLCLCSHHTSRVSHHIFGEPNFYHVHCSRPAMPNHRILFSRFLKSFNTRATPEKYLPTMIFPPIGQSLEKTNRLLYICLDPVCQLINPLSFSTLRKQCSGLDSPYSFKQAFLYLVYSPHLA